MGKYVVDYLELVDRADEVKINCFLVPLYDNAFNDKPETRDQRIKKLDLD